LFGSTILYGRMHRPINRPESRSAMLPRISIQKRSKYVTWMLRLLRWIHHWRVPVLLLLLLMMMIPLCRETHVMLWIWVVRWWYRTSRRIIHRSVVASRMVVVRTSREKRLRAGRHGEIWRVMGWPMIGRHRRRVVTICTSWARRTHIFLWRTTNIHAGRDMRDIARPAIIVHLARGGS
jgi:hypothetical protein